MFNSSNMKPSKSKLPNFTRQSSHAKETNNDTVDKLTFDIKK